MQLGDGRSIEVTVADRRKHKAILCVCCIMMTQFVLVFMFVFDILIVIFDQATLCTAEDFVYYINLRSV